VHTAALLDNLYSRQGSYICGSQSGCHIGSLMLDLGYVASTVASGDQGKAASAGRLRPSGVSQPFIKRLTAGRKSTLTNDPKAKICYAAEQ